jgi:hypothetical protein
MTIEAQPKLTPSERGRKGALARIEKYGPEVLSAMGKKGGTTTKEKHGPAHYSAIGKEGLQARIETRWDGDRQAYFTWLSMMGNHATDPAPWNGIFPHPGDEPAPAHLVVTPAMWQAHFHPSEN